MKRQSELEAALVVIAVFSMALLTLLFILKWDDIVYFCRKSCLFVRTWVQDTADSVHSYSDLNELLFDAGDRGGTLRSSRNEDGVVVVEKETIDVDSFFPNVLNGEMSSKRKKSRQIRTAAVPAEEPLL